jgi:hypothetical protein
MFTPSKRLITIMATAALGVAGAAAPSALAKHGADDPAPHHHVGDHVLRAHDHGDRDGGRNDVGDDRGHDAFDHDRGDDRGGNRGGGRDDGPNHR